VADQFIIIPDQLTTVQDVVNLCLASIGEAPVNTIEPSPGVDVDKALLILNQYDKTVQSKGWWWNQETFKLSLDADSKIPLPNQTLHVRQAYRDGMWMNLVDRGGFLYDVDLNSYTFTAPVMVDLIVRQPWENLPDAARMYIGMLTIRSFQAGETDRAVKFQVSAEDVRNAMVTLEQREDEYAHRNAGWGNRSVVSSFYAGPRRRYR